MAEWVAWRLSRCLPPLQWQTHDIDFTPVQFGSDGKKTKNVLATVRHSFMKIRKSKVRLAVANLRRRTPTR